MSAGGRWLPHKTSYHINCLELLAGSLAIMSFTKNKARAQVLLLMDNISAVIYINKMDGDSLPHVVLPSQKPLGLVSHPQYPSVSSIHSRSAECRSRLEISRVFQNSSDWKQNPAVFDCLYHKWGPLNIYLFASRLSFQLDQFVSWRPDPLAVRTDVFTLDWGTFQGYAFPPFTLIGRCLRQIQSQQVSHMVLVAPVWPAQSWYPLLLDLCTDFPVLIPIQEDLTQGARPHPLKHLQLAGWLLSGEDTKRQTFLKRVENSSWELGGKTQLVPILVHGQSGVAGVVSESMLIPFHHL